MNDPKLFKHGEEGTHWCCNARLAKEGGKARCCECVPHKGCHKSEVLDEVEKLGNRPGMVAAPKEAPCVEACEQKKVEEQLKCDHRFFPTCMVCGLVSSDATPPRDLGGPTK